MHLDATEEPTRYAAHCRTRTRVVSKDRTCSRMLALDIIGALDILPRLYTQIRIPPQVAQETGLAAPWLVVQL